MTTPDNAVAESFFPTIKCEVISDQPGQPGPCCTGAVFDCIEGCYNIRRLHSTLNHLSPPGTRQSTTTAVTRRHDQLSQ